MSKVPVPHVASADELRITQDGDLAILAHADGSVMTPQLEIDAAKLATMRASDLVAYWNEHARGDDAVAPTALPAAPEPPPATEPAPVVKVAKVVKVAPVKVAPVKVAPAPVRKRVSKPASKSDAPSAPPPARPISAPAPKLVHPKQAHVVHAKHAHVVPLPIASNARIDQLEQRFQALALEIGLSRAEGLLRRVRAAARRLVE